MEKGAQSCLGQVLAVGGMQVTAGGTQVSTGRTQVSTGGMQVSNGRDKSCPWAGCGRDPKLSSPLSRSIYQAKIGGAM